MTEHTTTDDEPDILSFFLKEEENSDIELGEDFRARFLDLRTHRQDTLEEVQQQFFEALLTGKHTTCSNCTRRVKMYRRKLNPGMASVLLWVYRATPVLTTDEGWIHISNALLEMKMNAVAKEYSKLRFWGLLEEMPKQERDRTKRGTGYWRITERGRQFCEGKLKVAQRIYIFDNRLFGRSKETVSCREALDDRFDWNELMNGDLSELIAAMRCDEST